MEPNERIILEVKDLKQYFPIQSGFFLRVVGHVKAVDGVSFFIRENEVLGLVGESGCGKSTTGRTILQLYRPTSGDVYFEGEDLVEMKGEQLRRQRRKMQMIFQDPYASLNPRMTVGSIVGEPLEVHNVASGRARQERVQELLNLVGRHHQGHQGQNAAFTPVIGPHNVQHIFDRNDNDQRPQDQGKHAYDIGGGQGNGIFTAKTSPQSVQGAGANVTVNNSQGCQADQQQFTPARLFSRRIVLFFHFFGLFRDDLFSFIRCICHWVYPCGD